MSKIDKQVGCYLSCPDFWWSNNPALRRNEAIYAAGTLPLDVNKDGPKGTGGWSKPELEAPSPGKAWIHKWGMFVHDRTEKIRSDKCIMTGERCKYGFDKNGCFDDVFCRACDMTESYWDMSKHEERYRRIVCL